MQSEHSLMRRESGIHLRLNLLTQIVEIALLESKWLVYICGHGSVQRSHTFSCLDALRKVFYNTPEH